MLIKPAKRLRQKLERAGDLRLLRRRCALVECSYMYPTSDEQSLEQNTDLYQI